MALSIAGLKASAILTAPWTLSCYVSCCSGMLPKQKEGEAHRPGGYSRAGSTCKGVATQAHMYTHANRAWPMKDRCAHTYVPLYTGRIAAIQAMPLQSVPLAQLLRTNKLCKLSPAASVPGCKLQE